MYQTRQAPGSIGRLTAPTLSTPASNLEVGEVRLPELVDGGGLVLELVRRPNHYVGWVGDHFPMKVRNVTVPLGLSQ